MRCPLFGKNLDPPPPSIPPPHPHPPPAARVPVGARSVGFERAYGIADWYSHEDGPSINSGPRRPRRQITLASVGVPGARHHRGCPCPEEIKSGTNRRRRDYDLRAREGKSAKRRDPSQSSTARSRILMYAKNVAEREARECFAGERRDSIASLPSRSPLLLRRSRRLSTPVHREAPASSRRLSATPSARRWRLRAVDAMVRGFRECPRSRDRSLALRCLFWGLSFAAHSQRAADHWRACGEWEERNRSTDLALRLAYSPPALRRSRARLCALDLSMAAPGTAPKQFRGGVFVGAFSFSRWACFADCRPPLSSRSVSAVLTASRRVSRVRAILLLRPQVGARRGIRTAFSRSSMPCCRFKNPSAATPSH